MSQLESLKEDQKYSPKAASLAYKVFVIILVILLLIESVLVVRRYTLRQTYMSQELLMQYEADLPAITVCNSLGYKKEVLMEHGIHGVRRYNHKINLTWASNQTGITPQELFELATFKVTDLIERVTFKLFKPTQNGENMVNMDLHGENVVENRHRKFGKCFSIHPEGEYKKIGISHIEFVFKKDVKIYYHKKGTFLDLSGRMGYFVNLGKNLSGNVFYDEVSILEKSRYWSLFDSSMFICSNYGYDKCIYNALWKLMEDEAGCTVPWIYPNHNICTNDTHKINTTFWLAWNRVTNQEKDCDNPCDFQIINVASMTSQKMSFKNISMYTVYLPSRVQVNTEHYLYLFLDAAAEIGGYVGILLGVSFYDLAFEMKNAAMARLQAYKATADEVKKYERY